MTKHSRPAAAALLAIGLAVAAGFIPVVYLGIDEGVSRGGLIDAYVLQIVWFTVLQALLSTVLSVGLAIPAARAFSRRDFPGRALILRLFALPPLLPARRVAPCNSPSMAPILATR